MFMGLMIWIQANFLFLEVMGREEILDVTVYIFKSRGLAFLIRKFWFSQRVVDHWNALPAEAVNAPTINAFKNYVGPVLKQRGGLTISQRRLLVDPGTYIYDHTFPEYLISTMPHPRRIYRHTYRPRKRKNCPKQPLLLSPVVRLITPPPPLVILSGYTAPSH